MMGAKRKQFSCDLPEDVMVEIIMRLPFESIMALKCVSKQWKDVINDPKLLNRYGVDKIVTFPAGDTFNYLSLITNTTTTDLRYPPFTVRRIPSTFSAAGKKQYLKTKKVCDGMACYYRFGRRPGGQFLFYNLLTGASHTIENAPLLNFAGNEDDDASWPWICYGFGYDPHDENYKMMVVCKYSSDKVFRDFDVADEQSENCDVFWVYSFKNCTWVRRVGFPSSVYKFNRIFTDLNIACALNGKLHWVVRVRQEEKMVILTFNLHTYGFCEMELPSTSDSYMEGNLIELRGRLCYWICSMKKIHMWMMDYDDLWTKLFEMAFVMYYSYMLEPVTIYHCCDGRELVLFVCPRNGSLCWYHTEDGKVVKVVNQSTWLKTKVVGSRQRMTKRIAKPRLQLQLD